jgi:hypothetical protein
VLSSEGGFGVGLARKTEGGFSTTPLDHSSQPQVPTGPLASGTPAVLHLPLPMGFPLTPVRRKDVG